MINIVGQRSPLVSLWVLANQDAFRLLPEPPLFCGGKEWTPTYEGIARVPYRLWEEGGKMDGHADADWAQAERLLGIVD